MSITCSSVDVLNVFHLNIRSVNCNLIEFMVILDQFRICFNVIVLRETYLFSDKNPPIVEGYTGFSVSRAESELSEVVELWSM